jgi:hypothetical protein
VDADTIVIEPQVPAEIARQMSVDVEAIISHADEAVRQASETGRGLIPQAP